MSSFASQDIAKVLVVQDLQAEVIVPIKKNNNNNNKQTTPTKDSIVILQQ